MPRSRIQRKARPALRLRPPGRRATTLVVAGAVMLVVVGSGIAGWSTSVSAGPMAISTNTLAAPTSLSLTGGATVTLSWTATPSAWATGTEVLRSSTTGGPYAQIAQIAGLATTSFSDTPGTGNYYYVVRAYYSGNGAHWTSANSSEAADNKPYVFQATTANTGTKCRAASNQYDMSQNYSPGGSYSTTNNQTTSLCSATFAAGASLAAGTSAVKGFYANFGGSACTVTYTLYKDGNTSLGSGSITIPANTYSAITLTASFATGGTAFAAGDRLNVGQTWGGGCASGYFAFDSSAYASQLTTP